MVCFTIAQANAQDDWQKKQDRAAQEKRDNYQMQVDLDKRNPSRTSSSRESTAAEKEAFNRKYDFGGKYAKADKAAAEAAAIEAKRQQEARAKQYTAERAEQWERDRPQREADEALQQKYQRERQEVRQERMTTKKEIGAKKAIERAAEFPAGVKPLY